MVVRVSGPSPPSGGKTPGGAGKNAGVPPRGGRRVCRRDPTAVSIRMKHTISALAALIVILLLPFTAAAQTPPVRYRVVQLTEVPSPGGCVPTAIHDNGDVVGYCGAGEAGSFAVLWRGGTVV